MWSVRRYLNYHEIHCFAKLLKVLYPVVACTVKMITILSFNTLYLCSISAFRIFINSMNIFPLMLIWEIATNSRFESHMETITENLEAVGGWMAYPDSPSLIQVMLAKVPLPTVNSSTYSILKFCCFHIR